MRMIVFNHCYHPCASCYRHASGGRHSILFLLVLLCQDYSSGILLGVLARVPAPFLTSVSLGSKLQVGQQVGLQVELQVELQAGLQMYMTSA